MIDLAGPLFEKVFLWKFPVIHSDSHGSDEYKILKSNFIMSSTK